MNIHTLIQTLLEKQLWYFLSHILALHGLIFWQNFRLESNTHVYPYWMVFISISFVWSLCKRSKRVGTKTTWMAKRIRSHSYDETKYPNGTKNTYNSQIPVEFGKLTIVHTYIIHMLYTIEHFIAAIRIGQHRNNTNTFFLDFPSSLQGLVFLKMLEL